MEEDDLKHSQDQIQEQEHDQEELPSWLRRGLKSVESMPAIAARLPIWLPTLIAAWHTGSKALALSTALRDEIREDGPINWPDELIAELMLTLGELVDSFPSLEELLPVAADLMELGAQATEDQRAQKIVQDAITTLESLAQRLLTRIFDIAFFSPPKNESGERASHIFRLLTRLEELLNRLLQLWLTQATSDGASS